MAVIRLAKESDIAYVAEHMREADRQEVAATGNYGPEEALRKSYELSEPCYAGTADGVPAALFGVAPMSEEVGAIWLLGTDAITNDIPTAFLRHSKRFLPFLTEPYDMVCNIVDKRNEVHIKWIKWLGFSFIRELNYGPKDLPFYEFARLNNV